jgi:trans-aconitate methyltransferase
MTREQKWAADDYAQTARFVADLAGGVFAWLAPLAGERILDLGCGDGALTVKIVEAGAEVLGIDGSENMVEAARKLGLGARVGDGQALDFNNEFDAVFSNAALHWMLDADAVISGVKRALKPGGRFVTEFGGHGNVAAIVTAMRAVAQRRGGDDALVAPWFFPSPDEYRERLEAQGLTVRRVELHPRPTLVNAGMGAWLKTFRTPFFAQFGTEEDAVLEEVTDLLAPVLRDTRGNWTVDYVRLRVEAERD